MKIDNNPTEMEAMDAFRRRPAKREIKCRTSFWKNSMKA